MLKSFSHSLIGGVIMRRILDKSCLKWIIISELTGIVSGLLSLDGMRIYNANVTKAPLTPPGWVFAVVWTILYTFMGIGACLVSNGEETKGRSCCINLFVAQLIVNFFWSLIFLTLKNLEQRWCGWCYYGFLFL